VVELLDAKDAELARLQAIESAARQLVIKWHLAPGNEEQEIAMERCAEELAAALEKDGSS
jgi:hypothetical protein